MPSKTPPTGPRSEKCEYAGDEDSDGSEGVVEQAGAQAPYRGGFSKMKRGALREAHAREARHPPRTRRLGGGEPMCHQGDGGAKRGLCSVRCLRKIRPERKGCRQMKGRNL